MAGWVIFLSQPTAVATRLRMLFVQLATPFVRLGDYIPSVKSRRALDQQNRQLRADNQALRQQLNNLVEAGRENLRLQRLLDLKQNHPLRTVTARVIGRDAGNWWQSLQLDRGRHAGLRENLAVLNADGLIGKTVTVSAGESRILLLTDPNCKVSAIVQETREPGVVAGLTDTRLVMTFVHRQAKIPIGAKVISSGLGGVFPKGVLIGTVTKAEINAGTGMYQDLEIQPAVDFRRLEEVLVVLE